MDFIAIAKKAQTSPFTLWKLNFGLFRFIPFNKPHGIKIKELKDNSVTSIIPKKRANHNHIKGIHACGLATCAEFCTGLMLLRKLGMKEYRLIMESLDIKFHYQAKSDVTAFFEVTDEDVTIIKKALETEDSTYKKCEVKLHDKDGNHIATCVTNWQIKDWKKVRTKV